MGMIWAGRDGDGAGRRREAGMAAVTVRGRAEADVEPDRVRLVLVVQAEAAVAADALAALAARSAALDAALDGADLLLRRPSGVTVGVLWSRDGEPSGQVARRVVRAEARADAPLGDLLAAVAAVPGSIESTEWLVDPANPVHGRLRGLAVADARQRAADYAAAAGLALGAVESITEPALADPAFRAMALGKTEGAAGPVLELRPEPVAVGAEVDVRYALLPAPQP